MFNAVVGARGWRQELAECEMELGNKARAEKLHKAAVAVLEHNNGENDLSVAAALDARGELLLKAHRLSDAEACYTRALRIKQVAVGDSHPAVAAALYNLANVLDHVRSPLASPCPTHAPMPLLFSVFHSSSSNFSHCFRSTRRKP